MKVRAAESNDREQIREITRDSLQASYSLSPEQIEVILEEEFSDAAIDDLLDDAETTVLVVEATIDDVEAVRGFVTLETGTEAAIRWLHVDPASRGEGIATALLDRVRDQFSEKPLSAYILDDAVEGGEFLEEFGLKQNDHDRLLIGGEEFPVTAFTEGESTERTNEPTVSVPGSEAPFFTVYTTDEGDEQYGYFCSECGSTNVSTDGLDRLECGNCGNVHRADEWDDAYL